MAEGSPSESTVGVQRITREGVDERDDRPADEEPMIVAAGAPSSLAVDMAERFGMTLIGFASASASASTVGPLAYSADKC